MATRKRTIETTPTAQLTLANAATAVCPFDYAGRERVEWNTARNTLIGKANAIEARAAAHVAKVEAIRDTDEPVPALTADEVDLFSSPAFAAWMDAKVAELDARRALREGTLDNDQADVITDVLAPEADLEHDVAQAAIIAEEARLMHEVGLSHRAIEQNGDFAPWRYAYGRLYEFRITNGLPTEFPEVEAAATDPMVTGAVAPVVDDLDVAIERAKAAMLAEYGTLDYAPMQRVWSGHAWRFARPTWRDFLNAADVLALEARDRARYDAGMTAADFAPPAELPFTPDNSPLSASDIYDREMAAAGDSLAMRVQPGRAQALYDAATALLTEMERDQFVLETMPPALSGAAYIGELAEDCAELVDRLFPSQAEIDRAARKARIEGIRAELKARKISYAALGRMTDRSPSAISYVMRGNYPYTDSYHLPHYLERELVFIGVLPQTEVTTQEVEPEPVVTAAPVPQPWPAYTYADLPF